MTSPTTDRKYGLLSGAAIKVPCVAATTANITLNGEQTIDGRACVSGDRVLVKNQTDGTENGIYDCDTGEWTRSTDFNANQDVVTGTLVMVIYGTANANTYWRVSTAGAITIGTTSIAFATGLAGDAEMVSFLQAGSGAVSRSVRSKLRESVSITDFGASTTASAATNTTAITAAMAAANEVIVPEGTFAVNSITVPADTWLVGTSNTGSILSTTGSQILLIDDVANVTVDNLKLVSTGTAYGNTINVIQAANNITVQNCVIESAYRPFMSGDDAYANGPTYVKFLYNKTYTTNTDGGLRTRSGSGLTGEYVWFIGNTIINDNAGGEDVGIEAWTSGTVVADNLIFATHFAGGYSGITFGVGGYSIARNNRIIGFSAGVEVGNTGLGLHVIDGNIILHCKRGVLVSTGGVEEAVTITNNQILTVESVRSDFEYGIYVQCQAASITNNTVYYHNAGNTSYTSSASRKGVAVAADTNNEQILISGNVFKNLIYGISAAATSRDVQVLGNDFYNVKIPLYDSGGSPNTYFANNNVQEFAYNQVNLYANFCNNEFSRSSNYPNGDGASISTSPFVQSYNAANVVIVNSNNRFTYVLGTAFALDAGYYAQGLGYDRPKVEVIDGTYKVTNYSNPAASVSILATCGFNAGGKIITEWFTSNTYVVTAVGNVQSYGSAAPASGTWVQGDIVWNTAAASGGAPGWMCTAGGTPGTWKAMANLA